MQDKVLTISIASYNSEKYILETVGSLIMDSKRMDELEIIIVNDGSKDRTSEIAHGLAGKYPDSIRVIDKENGGYGSTINASLRMATGKYYKLLDGDDWYDTGALSAFLGYLENAESDLVITPYTEVRHEKRTVIDNHAEIPEKAVSFDQIQIENPLFAMHEITIRTERLKAVEKSIAEHCFYTDSEFVFYCLAASGTVSRFETPVYDYRLGVEGQSVSLTGIQKHQKELPIVMNRIVSCHAEDCEKITGTRRRILDCCVSNIIYHTYRSFLLMENPREHKAELLKLDRELKEKYRAEYLLGNKSNLVRMARMTRFIPYTTLSRITKESYLKETNQ